MIVGQILPVVRVVVVSFVRLTVVVVVVGYPLKVMMTLLFLE